MQKHRAALFRKVVKQLHIIYADLFIFTGHWPWHQHHHALLALLASVHHDGHVAKDYQSEYDSFFL